MMFCKTKIITKRNREKQRKTERNREKEFHEQVDIYVRFDTSSKNIVMVSSITKQFFFSISIFNVPLLMHVKTFLYDDIIHVYFLYTFYHRQWDVYHHHQFLVHNVFSIDACDQSLDINLLL